MAAAILKEIAKTKKFVKSRETATGASCDPCLLKNFASSLIKMINSSAVFGLAEGGQVNDALSDSPYTEDGIAEIMKAIDARVNTGMAGVSASRKAKQAPTGQLLKYWWKYCTKADWDFVQDPKRGLAAKMTRMVERANSVGCITFDEQTYKWLLAFLMLIHYQDLPSYLQIYQKLQELKQCQHSECKQFDHEMLIDFPEDPKDLPDRIYRAAYGDEPPVAAECPGVHTVASHIPLQANSKLLRGPTKAPTIKAECDTSIQFQPDAHVHPSATSSRSSPHIKAEATAPEDADERALWLDYQQKLHKLRATDKLKNEPDDLHEPPWAAPRGASMPASCHAGIQISRTSDGRLRLQPRSGLLRPKVAQQPVPRRMSVKQPPRDAAPPVTAVFAPPVAGVPAAAPDENDLDPYSKQALDALRKRNIAKKAEQAEKKAEHAAARASGRADATPASGHTAAAKKTARRHRSAKPMKGRHPKAVKTEPVAVSAGAELKKTRVRGNIEDVPSSKVLQARPKLPGDGSNPPPVYFNGGAIYTSCKVNRYRALGCRGDNYSETSVGWNVHGSQAKAWAVAVESINKYQKNIHKKKKKTE